MLETWTQVKLILLPPKSKENGRAAFINEGFARIASHRCFHCCKSKLWLYSKDKMEQFHLRGGRKTQELKIDLGTRYLCISWLIQTWRRSEHLARLPSGSLLRFKDKHHICFLYWGYNGFRNLQYWTHFVIRKLSENIYLEHRDGKTEKGRGEKRPGAKVTLLYSWTEL